MVFVVWVIVTVPVMSVLYGNINIDGRGGNVVIGDDE